MRRIVACTALLVLPFSLHAAADEAKPNTLTPKEVADGWLLLFDGATTFGWKIDGEAKVEKGLLVLGGAQATTARTTTAFQNPFCSFSMELRWAGTKAPSFAVPDVMGGGLTDKAKEKFVTQSIEHLRPPVQVPPPRAEPWSFTVPAGTQLFVRNAKVRPLTLKPIFNGKDLAGWQEHAGKKSKFAVKDGAINVKDGPGDLQTEGAWADFVLQLECLANGKQLNSGIFFRCIPGQYQQGYEAQIHNGWLPEPSKEYAVEEYDPESGKVVKTEKVKSAAMDFGTGAIYRRVPARQAVAKDGEWFTLTVVAQGRHIATWVNGIQVVDWTDSRPLKDNARNGCRLEKGPISIQGHDPTTDLSFRNIRIAELPTPAVKK